MRDTIQVSITTLSIRSLVVALSFSPPFLTYASGFLFLSMLGRGEELGLLTGTELKPVALEGI